MRNQVRELADEVGMLRERLNAVKQIIDRVENRCMACDGPVTPTHKEITDEEIRRIYRLAGGSTR